ncbi:hypothetical protein N7447_003107 [Penicillium robsamsonii]|uniref:uncharacterized protein n=1 Tax=Penicillium robsamsonii TaxID=1792511 RepID=UPI002549301B|nr:uncharacterized protein N7447_003107 [Penicillium robsamsonii]KAJ5837081.1 hypothetical protein N7447_003107 [Penicillium robsamsonii]
MPKEGNCSMVAIFIRCLDEVVDSDDPLLPGGFIELEPPEVEEEDDPDVEDPDVDDIDVVEPDLDIPGIDVSELKPTNDDIPVEDPVGALDPGVPEGVVVSLPVPITGVDVTGSKEVTGLEEERGTFVNLLVDEPRLGELALK